MQFTLENGKKIGAVWHYDHFIPTKENKLRVATTCTLFDLSEGTPKPVSQFVFKLYSKRNHCKDTARKVTLLRTMQQLKFDKEQRYKIWQQYFAIRGFMLNGSELKAVQAGPVSSTA